MPQSSGTGSTPPRWNGWHFKIRNSEYHIALKKENF